MPHVTNFVLQRQQETNWCWAAVGTSIAECFGRPPQWTQCTLASQITGLSCCLDAGPCNRQESLRVTLETTTNLNAPMQAKVAFEVIRDEIVAGRPVAIRIGRTDGSGHFVVISGFEMLPDGDALLTIRDPWSGTDEVPFQQLRDGIYSEGRWSHTYLTE